MRVCRPIGVVPIRAVPQNQGVPAPALGDLEGGLVAGNRKRCGIDDPVTEFLVERREQR